MQYVVKSEYYGVLGPFPDRQTALNYVNPQYNKMTSGLIGTTSIEILASEDAIFLACQMNALAAALKLDMPESARAVLVDMWNAKHDELVGLSSMNQMDDWQAWIVDHCEHIDD